MIPRLSISIASLGLSLLVSAEQETLQRPHQQTQPSEYHKVPVMLGVMSRCPDALYCEQVFDTVLDTVGFDQVELDLGFIARLNESDPEYGVTCMHGPLECAGNVHELCVAKHVRKLDAWWPWLECMDMAGRDKIGLVETAVECAWMSGIDWVESGVRECVNGSEGKTLLKQSMERAELAGVRKSCTIVVSGKVRCVRDGGEWSECEDGHTVEDLSKTIRDEWTRLNPDPIQQ